MCAIFLKNFLPHYNILLKISVCVYFYSHQYTASYPQEEIRLGLMGSEYPAKT